MSKKLAKAIDALGANCPIQVHNHTHYTVETKRCRGDITLQSPVAASCKAIIHNSNVYLDYFDRIIVKCDGKIIRKLYIAYKDDKHTQVIENEVIITKEKQFKHFELAKYEDLENPDNCPMPPEGVIELMISQNGQHEILSCTNNKRSRKAHNHY